ncbi:MAG: DNA polymerase III subunit delta' [Nitrospirae bacterium]|nr:DNA polymerase III subunit delta' [Nitrospirota bacterium]
MALKNIIGHEKVLGILGGLLVKNRIGHAYLFAGEPGIGKRLTAINFAKTLNCQKPVTSNELQVTTKNKDSSLIEIDCCDKCPSCIKTDKAIHPDVFFLRPEGDGKQITIQMIRDMEEALSYRSFEGGWKVVIIDEAETLNQSSANAFLKTLEEPPERTVLILISSMPEMILETILSRCQRINFSPLPLKEMCELLKFQDSTPKQGRGKVRGSNSKLKSEDEYMLLSVLSTGSLRLASKDLLEKRDVSFHEFTNLLGDILNVSWEDKSSMEEWFEWTQLWLRDIAIFNATNNRDLLINYDKEVEIKGISEKGNLRDILTLAERLNNIKGLLRFNLNKDITFYYTYFLFKKYLTNTNALN